MPRRKVALILGAGFSTEAGLPTTPGLSEHFLSLPSIDGIDEETEREISRQLADFWRLVFCYNGDQRKLPLLEDHFTLIDLAANTGHQLGPGYSPRRLRAIRRLSIHRVFQILNLTYRSSPDISGLLRFLSEEAEASIVSTNWDIVVEKHLHADNISYNYGSNIEPLLASRHRAEGISILKLHGSANWVYCDSCRTLFAGEPTRGKTALDLGAYLEPEDFKALKSSAAIVRQIAALALGAPRRCRICHAQMTARVGTFSYRKDYAIQQFQTIWHSALKKLRESDHWLFIGYSMPEADFEFKQVLKSAQLSRSTNPKLQIVLKGDTAAADRYKRFFGLADEAISQAGLAEWYKGRFRTWRDELQNGASEDMAVL